MGTLYPPILDTTQPAFVNTEECKVYFIINGLNTIADYNMNLVQIKVTDNRTGKTILRQKTYPNAIKFMALEENQNYITLSHNDLNIWDLYDKTQNDHDRPNEEFPINNYYKVQIRFTSKSVETIAVEEAASNQEWINKNSPNFSAWSSACLIRAISLPTPVINSAINNIFMQNETDQFINSDTFSFVGKLNFAKAEELDSLASYRIRLYTTQQNGNQLQILNLLENSGILTPTNRNEFNYNINYTFSHIEPNTLVNYIIKLNYTTAFGYTNEIEYILPIKILYNILDDSVLKDSVITTTAIPELGAIRISINLNNNSNFVCNVNKINIYRAELKDRYSTWTLMYEIKEPFTILNKFTYEWDDIISESSEGYHYKVRIFISEANGELVEGIKDIKTQLPALLLLDDIFLVSKGISLKVRYNPDITNFKHVLSESIVNTLGSKYPYIRRNGHMNYRLFSIGGLLSCNTESELYYDLLTHNNKFLEEAKKTDTTSEKGNESQIVDLKYSNSLFMRNTADYLDIFKDLSKADVDIIYEKIFRDKVMNFLYDDSVKLFKSATEGNILVKLTNISFTPNKQLGRKIYSFTALATEIADATYENYKKYNIFESETTDILNTLNVLTVPFKEISNIYPENVEISYTEVEWDHDSNNTETIYFIAERGVD